jgi:hypothetical protein
MTGILSGIERSYMVSTAEDIFSTNILLVIPESVPCTAVGCGLDSFGQGGLNISCPVCDGTGRIVTITKAKLWARVSIIAAGVIVNWQGVSSGELGDIQFQGKLRDGHLYRKVMDNPDAYILLDGKKNRPVSVVDNRVEGKVSVDVRCKLVTGALGE